MNLVNWKNVKKNTDKCEIYYRCNQNVKSETRIDNIFFKKKIKE